MRTETVGCIAQRGHLKWILILLTHAQNLVKNHFDLSLTSNIPEL